MAKEIIEIGRIEENTNEVTEIKWTIHKYFLLMQDIPYSSPKFSFENDTWCIIMILNWKGYTILNLNNKAKRDYSIQYNFFLKERDGSVAVELPEEEIMNGNHCFSASHFFIEFSELQLRMNKLLPSTGLTITCTLKRKNVHFKQPYILNKKAPLELIRLEKLSENFKELFDDKETCDTCLVVKDKEYRVHRSVLIARSTVFAANFKHDTLEKQTGVITITDCDPDSFQKFLEYLYCGRIEEISDAEALNLYYTSDKYDLEELKLFCVDCLMQCLTAENLSDVASFADKCEENELFSSVQDFFNKNICQILETSEWENLLKENYRLANKLMKNSQKKLQP